MTDYLSELNAARAALNESPWYYNGDQSLECGGLYWREDGFDDYVMAVEVTPCSDGGGPDNKFEIRSGSIYMPADKLESALGTIGMKPGEETLTDRVYAFRAYYGVESSGYGGETILQIGDEDGDEDDYCRGWNPEATETLDEDTDLRKYVEENYLD